MCDTPLKSSLKNLQNGITYDNLTLINKKIAYLQNRRKLPIFAIFTDNQRVLHGYITVISGLFPGLPRLLYEPSHYIHKNMCKLFFSWMSF